MNAALPLLRAVFAAYWLMTSLGCLLLYRPDFIPHVIPAQFAAVLPAFGYFHPWLFWMAQACALATLDTRQERVQRRWPRRVFLAFTLPVGVMLAVYPIFSSLHNGQSTFPWAVWSLIPLVVLAAIDWGIARSKLPSLRDREVADSRVLPAAVMTGLLVWACSAAGACIRARGAITPLQAAGALSGSLMLHLIAAGALFAALRIAVGGPRFLRSHGAELLFAGATMAVCVALLLALRVFPGFGFTGPRSVLLASAVGLALGVSTVCLGLRLAGSRTGGALDVLLRPLLLTEGPWLRWTLPAVFALGTLWGWQPAALGLWATAFAALVVNRDPPTIRFPVRRGLAIGAATMLLAGCWGWSARGGWPADRENLAGVAKYAAFDGSFRLLSGLAGFSVALDDASFFDELRLHRQVSAEPAEIMLGGRLQTGGDTRPNIFVIVVEGLETSRWSPAIDSFARDSDVFVRAFSHYGSAVLSERSVRTAALMPESLHPTTTPLQELVAAEHYRICRSLDQIEQCATPAFAYAEATQGDEMDRGFGRFVAALKARNLYDESIIVLAGIPRAGATHLSPTEVRAPLIVRLPPALRASLATDTDDLAFTSDITPTLFALLGHPLLQGDPLFGVSLYSATGAAPRHTGPQMIVSGDGSQYGLVANGGRSLYIADAERFTDDAYDLSDADAPEKKPISVTERDQNRRRIRSVIAAMTSFYR